MVIGQETAATIPDGTMQKLMEVSHMKHLGWTTTTSLCRGIMMAYQSYFEKINNYQLKQVGL